MGEARKPTRKRAPRTTQRVTESGKASSVKDSEITNPRKTDSPITREIPIGANGRPMLEFWVQSSETVPVAQFANVVVGPVGIRKWIEDNGDSDEIMDALKEHINRYQDLVEEIVGEDRDIVFESVKFYNEMKEAEEAKKAKKS